MPESAVLHIEDTLVRGAGMGLCASLIRKHISLLDPGEIFTTRDCLGYGTRGAVDKNLFSLVRQGILTRLAWGVFVLTEKMKADYTPLEIAERKAKAFGKQYFRKGFNLNPEFRVFLKEKVEQDLQLCSSSRASKFHTRDESTGRCTFPVDAEARCAKLLRFGSEPVGRAIRMLCAVGKYDITVQLINSTLNRLGAKDEWEMRTANCWMPYWLSNILTNTRSQILCAKRFAAERLALRD